MTKKKQPTNIIQTLAYDRSKLTKQTATQLLEQIASSSSLFAQAMVEVDGMHPDHPDLLPWCNKFLEQQLDILYQEQHKGLYDFRTFQPGQQIPYHRHPTFVQLCPVCNQPGEVSDYPGYPAQTFHVINVDNGVVCDIGVECIWRTWQSTGYPFHDDILADLIPPINQQILWTTPPTYGHHSP